MKSLVLKDLYNIGHNAKSMLFTLVILAVAFIPTANDGGYIFASAAVCGMMILTTFAFDDNSGWTRYAMIMPVSRKDLVAGKFVVLVIFSAVGSLFGLAVSLIIRLAIRKDSFHVAGTSDLFLLALAAAVTVLIFGSMSIPLVLKFGAEKGRVLLIVSFLVPSAICFGIYKILVMLGVEMTETLAYTLLWCSPFAALLWCFAMYRISCRIFEMQEL